MHIVQVAAENDALPGGKVGGLGDVIRDLPIGLAQAGHEVTVITPGYGVFAATEGARELVTVTVEFCSVAETLSIFEVVPPRQTSGVRYLVLEHLIFSASGAGRIYVNDDAGPFATDAHKFALFGIAVAQALKESVIAPWDVLHCHDWHTAVLLLLRACDPRYSILKEKPAVYTIHNLSLQGVRPLRGVASSLESWLPGLPYPHEAIVDPHHSDCVNLMRCGINLADRVHTVSPTYAQEILRPSDWSEGIVGGEGLEQDLQQAEHAGHLFGILNGCEYDHKPRRPKVGGVWKLAEQTLDDWITTGQGNPRSHYFALKRMVQIKREQNGVRPCLVSIGRLTAQKLYLLVQNYQDRPVMDQLLEQLRSGIFIMLGSGDPFYEQFFLKAMEKHGNFVFLNGYSESLSSALYSFGDLFVMPSIYEPCGISQMLAMRAGVPCLVHQVGGLNDTVSNGQNGFSFGGKSLQEKQLNLLTTLDDTLMLFREQPEQWKKVSRAAAKARFTWDGSVQQYLAQLYRSDSPGAGASP
ncbi:MAG: glycogen synthase [Gammaproteobacteria bacterium]|nr:glycogen synthase [Gammaproteobacteria bacterium]